jgi:hypothetical protein
VNTFEKGPREVNAKHKLDKLNRIKGIRRISYFTSYLIIPLEKYFFDFDWRRFSAVVEEVKRLRGET